MNELQEEQITGVSQSLWMSLWGFKPTLRRRKGNSGRVKVWGRGEGGRNWTESIQI